MAGLTLNEEQTKLLRLCLKYAEPLKVGSRGKRRSYEPRFFIIAVISTKLTGHKPNWEKVTEEADLVSTSAASQRWGRLYKLLLGDEKPSTPSKAKGGASKANGVASKPRKTPSKKATASTPSKTSEEDTGEAVNGKTTTQPATPTTKKRAHEAGLGSDQDEDESPSQVKKMKSEDDG